MVIVRRARNAGSLYTFTLAPSPTNRQQGVLLKAQLIELQERQARRRISDIGNDLTSRAQANVSPANFLMDDLVRIVVKEEAGIPDSEVFVRSRASAQYSARLDHVKAHHDVVANARRHTLEVCNISYDSTQRNRQDKIQ